jgi:hypothetical protein
MENISGKSRASFRLMLSCATMGLAVSVSLCFAQGDRNAPQGLPKAFDQPKDWNVAIPAPFDPPKIANPVLGLNDPPYDWFTYFRRVPSPPSTVQSGK